jgi:hypothetical protein
MRRVDRTAVARDSNSCSVFAGQLMAAKAERFDYM